MFENQELGGREVSHFGSRLVAKPLRDPPFLRVQILSSALKGLEKLSKVAAKTPWENGDTTNNGQNSSDLDPGRGPAYLAKPVRYGLKKWPPKVALLDSFRARCLIKRLRLAFQTRSQAAPAAQ